MLRRTRLAAAIAVATLIGLPGPAAAATATRRRVVTLVNAARAKAGCAPLRVNAQLTRPGYEASTMPRVGD